MLNNSPNLVPVHLGIEFGLLNSYFWKEKKYCIHILNPSRYNMRSDSQLFYSASISWTRIDLTIFFCFDLWRINNNCRFPWCSGPCGIFLAGPMILEKNQFPLRLLFPWWNSSYTVQNNHPRPRDQVFPSKWVPIMYFKV